MTLYHATTLNKYKKYKDSGFIKSPVRGFDTLEAAMAWAMKTGRTMIIKIEDCNDTHKLPDHHNKYGIAFWNDKDTPNFSVEYSIH